MHRTALLLLPLLAAAVRAEPPAPLAERAKILRIELNRGPAEDLAPFLEDDANPLSRWSAIRALGRIGDRGEAPAMLAALLEGGKEIPELEGALWAAGIAATAKLADPIAKHLDDARPSVVAAAAEALGWTRETRFTPRLVELAGSDDAQVRAGALAGLARLGDDSALEAVLDHLDDPEGRFAAWMLAGRRRSKAQEGGGAWAGAPDLAKKTLKGLASDDAQVRLDHLRIAGILLPEEVDPTVLALAGDPDARVVSELVARVLAPRKGKAIDAVLVALAGHADPKVRSQVVDALVERPAGDALKARWKEETDPRLRVELAVALAKRGDEGPWNELAAAPPDDVEPVLLDLARARVLLASKRAEALDELFSFALTEPDVNRPPPWVPLHPVVFAEIADGLGERYGKEGVEPDPRVVKWVEALLGQVPDFVPRPDVMAFPPVIELAGKLGLYDLAPDLFVPADKVGACLPARQAILQTFGLWYQRADCPADLRQALLAEIRNRAAHAPSAFTRELGRKILREIGVEDVPESDPGRPNDWAGLPRPYEGMFGLGLENGEGERLDEMEILRLADALTASRARVRFETTQGSFVVELFPEEAPVHSASLALSVVDDLYAGTRWHRVVPSFVIQGGDPSGTGAGGAGWAIPDEITRSRFVRGALGMPKSTKDDGGCQLFIMHSDYRPLDGRYTCYGRVVDGMDAVDRIRVGDRILSAKLLTE